MEKFILKVKFLHSLNNKAAFFFREYKFAADNNHALNT